MARQPQTVAQTAERIAQALQDRSDPFVPIRDFVDHYHRCDSASRPPLLTDEPLPTGDARLDAYLAAMAEHFARQDGFDPPSWVEAPYRFLHRSWFREPREHFWPLALVQTPLPFRRRFIFIEDSEFERV